MKANADRSRINVELGPKLTDDVDWLVKELNDLVTGYNTGWTRSAVIRLAVMHLVEVPAEDIVKEYRFPVEPR